jgi:threonine/homoserine/homoserine lactone efflux protein
VEVLQEVFRGKSVDGLKTMHAEHKLTFHGTLVSLHNPKAFAAWLRVNLLVTPITRAGAGRGGSNSPKGVS